MEASLSTSSSSVLILSEYEKLRERNIQRNNARLKALGLLSPHNHHHSNEENENERSSNKPLQKHKRRRRRRPLSTSNDNDGSGSTTTTTGRKSLRLQGKEPTKKLLPQIDESPEQPRRKPSKQTRPKKTDDDKENSQVSFSSSLEEEATIYQHTSMRIQSMSEKALKRRIQVIERAAGKQCFIKMKMFQKCLQDNEMWELADLAKNALERLLQKKKKQK
eukprot:scaffold3086_cov75-Cylindrotheca_fusiformis.AAC.8